MVEHLTMFGSSVLVFWPILNRSAISGRMNHGLQILYVFVLMVAQIPLFGILTFSTDVLYAPYELAPRISFLDPLADQVLGGLLMKIANMILSLFLIGRAFFLWNRMQELSGDPEPQVVQRVQDAV
jgi:cytochrome c oxidase assembly factor CtaG